MEQVEARTTGKTNGNHARDTALAAAHDSTFRMTEGSFDAGLQVLKDWQALMQAGAEMIGDNVTSTAAYMKDFAGCRTPEEFSNSSAVFGQVLTKRWLDTGQKLAALSAEFARQRVQVSTKLASSALNQIREG